MSGKPWKGCLQSTHPDAGEDDPPTPGWQRRFDARAHRQPVSFRMATMPSFSEAGALLNGGGSHMMPKLPHHTGDPPSFTVYIPNEPRSPESAHMRSVVTTSESGDRTSQDLQSHGSLPAYEEYIDKPPIYHR